jgi:hypothetical protein
MLSRSTSARLLPFQCRSAAWTPADVNPFEAVKWVEQLSQAEVDDVATLNERGKASAFAGSPPRLTMSAGMLPGVAICDFRKRERHAFGVPQCTQNRRPRSSAPLCCTIPAESEFVKRP